MRRFSIKSAAGMIFASLTVAVIGCGEGGFESQIASKSLPAPASPPPVVDASAALPATPQEGAADEATKSATAGRKIIYNAHVDVVTEDLNQLEAALTKLVWTHKAYVADSDRTGSAGSTRHGSWKVRVPVDLYDPFVKGAVALGELVSMKADSQDVSEEYFDLDARQAAKKVEEERLLRHLADSTGKLEEILAVERELSRVRSEIERMQGRLRALSNLTSLATVTVTASEIKGYVPPQAPTLGTRIGRTFAASLEALQQVGEGLLIGFVAIVPWLPLIALAVGLFLWRSRYSAARVRSTAPINVVPPRP